MGRRIIRKKTSKPVPPVIPGKPPKVIMMKNTKAITMKDAKELVIKTLDTRGCCTDTELKSLPEFPCSGGGDGIIDTELMFDELVSYYDIVAVDFCKEDEPNDIRTVYFPLGTVVYEPGLRVRGRVLPGLVMKGLKTLKERGIVNDDMLEDVPRQKLVEFYDAIHEQVVKNKSLNAETAHQILKKVMGTK